MRKRRCSKGGSWLFLLVVLIFALQTTLYLTTATEATNEEGEANSSTTETIKNGAKEESVKEGEEDWGSFYDPKEIFCGKYDCYKILGFDYLTFHVTKPSLKDITKSYRSLSRLWHPDKNRKKGAKEKFVKITRAYEVLSDKEKRNEYDYYRDRPDEYFHKYGSSVLWTYKPKSNTVVVIIGLFAAISALTYYAQKSRWNTVADHLIKAAVEDWSVSQGGSIESMDIRKRALEIMEQQNENNPSGHSTASGGETSNSTPTKPSSKSKKLKLTPKEKKKQSEEALRKIVTKLVYEIDDFGGSFHKPTYRDLFVYKLFLVFPKTIYETLVFRMQFLLRRLRKLPYSEHELEVFTRNAVGDVAWEVATPEEKVEWMKMELWVMNNFEKWKESQELKLLSPGYQKRHARWKKKQGSKMA